MIMARLLLLVVRPLAVVGSRL